MRGLLLLVPLAWLGGCDQVLDRTPYPAFRTDQGAETLPGSPDINAPVEGPSAEELARLPFNPSGWYRRGEPYGKLRIRPRGAGWEIYVKAEAENRGSATASTCELAAAGPLRDRTIVGRVIPFSSGLSNVDADSAARAPGPLIVKFRDGSAIVDDRANTPYCGIGSELGGTYVRDDSLAEPPSSIARERELILQGPRPPVAAVEGEYLNRSNGSQMTVRWTGRAWRIMLSISGGHADRCEFVTEGSLHAGRIVGRLVPYELASGPWLTARDITSIDSEGRRSLVVRLDGERAMVSGDYVGRMCGDRSGQGEYVRVTPQAPAQS